MNLGGFSAGISKYVLHDVQCGAQYPRVTSQRSEREFEICRGMPQSLLSYIAFDLLQETLACQPKPVIQNDQRRVKKVHER